MLSHPGRVRQGNEDACAASLEANAFVVCDGMGGAAAGEVASHLAAEKFLACLTPNGAEPSRPATPQVRLNAAIQAANHSIFQKAKNSPELSGMGTTLVALLYVPPSTPTGAAAPNSTPAPNSAAASNQAHTGAEAPDPTQAHAPTQPHASIEPHAPTEPHAATAPPATIEPYLPIDPYTPTQALTPTERPTLWLAHVGDSRCYLYRQRILTQLTADHSLVEEQLRAGQITAAEAARSPMRNFITRAVGSQSTTDADIQSLTIYPGDIYLLASDGLNRELSDSDIATVLADIPSPPTQPYLAAACQTLVNAANLHGGRDNITVLLVAFPKGIERRRPRHT